MMCSSGGCEMRRGFWFWSVALTALVLGGCTKEAASPTAPGAVRPAVAGVTNPDGSLLKATAPTPQSPINGVKVPQGTPVTLVIANSTTPYTNLIALVYRFEVSDSAGAVADSVIVPSGSGTTSHTVTAGLNGDQTYQWRARPEYQGLAGPWSTMASFVAPQNEGYNRPGALYDPLVNGKTIGTVGGSGNVTFVPGQGIRMNDQLAYVIYELPQVFSSGEISVEVTGLQPDGSPGKGRIFSILDRLGAPASSAKHSINVQYRGAGGAPANCITFKAILGDNAHSVEAANRFNNIFILDPSIVYLWQASWTPTSVRVLVKAGGATGSVVYDETANATSGTTDWNPAVMYAFLGTNNASYTGFDGTHEGMTLRNLWVGSTPRPANLGAAAQRR